MTCDKSCTDCPQVNGSYWLLPILLGAIGGIAMYLATKDINYPVARKGLLVGLYITVAPVAIFGVISLFVMNPLIGFFAMLPLAATVWYQKKSA